MADVTSSDPHLSGFPAFVNELAGTVAVHSQYVLHGNLRDQFLMRRPSGPPQPMSLLPLLWEALEPRGYECFVCYDPVHGFSVYPETAAAGEAAQRLLGRRVIGRRPILERVGLYLARAVGAPQQPPLEASGGGGDEAAAPGDGAQGPMTKDTVPPVRAAVVIDYASRITRVPGQLDPAERDFFLSCQKMALTAKPLRPAGTDGLLFNPVVWLADGERDLPSWLTIGVDAIRTIAVGTPTFGERGDYARLLVPMLPGAQNETSATIDRAREEFAKRTDGMTLRSMAEITRLSRDRGLSAGKVADAVRIYKLGIDDNPWRKDSIRAQITGGQVVIEREILGQDRAITKTLDILKRAALGLSGAQAAGSSSRPRGVLFFAGPTGVGKTELAKQISALLFGDAEAYLRFDMSEFAADHAADRLIGAPPGYVGYEAGGELTGAVRRNPFQVVLFDEIEKAHPAIFDKFLQILEDGRLTDGQGTTTYFSECVLIFTSNLGVVGTDSEGRPIQLVEPGISYKELEETVGAAIRHHFARKLARPELLNRFGDNIVIFDFISPETAQRICALRIENIVETVRRELDVTLDFTEHARQQLFAVCTADLRNGGRGIGNKLESNLINPLARRLFDQGFDSGSRVTVTEFHPGDSDTAPWLRVEKSSDGLR